MKNKYTAPVCKLFIVHVEEGIVANSIRSISGGRGSDYTPDVEDWTITDTESNGFEF